MFDVFEAEHVYIIIVILHMLVYMLLGRFFVDEMRDYEEVRVTQWGSHIVMFAGACFNLCLFFTAAVEADMCGITLFLVSFFMLLQLSSQRTKNIYCVVRAFEWPGAKGKPWPWMLGAIFFAFVGALLVSLTKDTSLQDCFENSDVCYIAVNLPLNYVLLFLNTTMCAVEVFVVGKNLVYLRIEIVFVNLIQTFCLSVAAVFYHAATQQCSVTYLIGERIALTVLSVSSLLVGVLPFFAVRWSLWSMKQRRFWQSVWSFLFNRCTSRRTYNSLSTNEQVEDEENIPMRTFNAKPMEEFATLMAAIAQNPDRAMERGATLSRMEVDLLKEMDIDLLLVYYYKLLLRAKEENFLPHLEVYSDVLAFCQTRFETDAVRRTKAVPVLDNALKKLREIQVHPVPEIVLSALVDERKPVVSLRRLLGFGSLMNVGMVTLYKCQEEQTDQNLTVMMQQIEEAEAKMKASGVEDINPEKGDEL